MGFPATASLPSLGIQSGIFTNVTANDTVPTGLSVVSKVVACYVDDLVSGTGLISCDIGDQAGSPVAGSFLLKTWRATSVPSVALAFGRRIAWVAIGTP